MMKHQSNQNGRDCQLNITIIFFFRFTHDLICKSSGFGVSSHRTLATARGQSDPGLSNHRAFAQIVGIGHDQYNGFLESFDFRCTNMG